MPTPITRNWEFTIPIPHWILHFFHIEEGLLITFNINISAYQTAEEFNSFAVGIFFRRRSERSLPPHLIEELRIILGFQWPNDYYQIDKDLIVCTPSRSSSITGVRTSGTTTPVDPPSEEEVEELHKIPLPPSPLPELEGLPPVAEINRRTEELRQRIEAHNRSLQELNLTPYERLNLILTRIRSGINLDEVAFQEGNITYRQLRRIDQGQNPHLYTEASLQADTAYEPPRYQGTQEEVEEEEEAEVEEQPLPVLLPLRTHSATQCSEHNSPELSEARLRESLEEHCGTLIEATFHLPTTPPSD